MKVFISQLMKDKSSEEIIMERDLAIKDIIAMGEKSGEDMVIINSYFSDYDPEKDLPGVSNVPLAYLAEAIKLLSTADAAYFCDGWAIGRGTNIEHQCAVAYGLTILKD